MLASSLATGINKPFRPNSIIPETNGVAWQSGWSVDELRELYQNGKSSNDLNEVGLTIHSFDGSEQYQQPWKPCSTFDWCKPFRTWWSASIINSKNGHTVSDCGILLSPKHTKVLCSAANATALGVDCTGAHLQLRRMLDKSMDEDMRANSLANEVRIDSQMYTQQLPASVAGIFYFDDAETPGRVDAARSSASNVYLNFLREYKLTEADVPLLRISRDPFAVVEESSMARASLRRHSYERFRAHHTGLDLPDHTPDDLGDASDTTDAAYSADTNGDAAEANRPAKGANPQTPDRLRVAKAEQLSPANWTMQELTELFKRGRPSNDLREIGLMVHGFDGMEDAAETWKPCSDSWCDKSNNLFDGEKLNKGQHWWSGSVVSARNYNTYSKAGIVLAPGRTRVMCSFFADFGSFDRGCATAGLKITEGGAIRPYPPEKLRSMLKVSYNQSAVENAMYNEIVVDANKYTRNLPGSIAAVVWFYDDSEAQAAANDQARMEATKAYIGILDAYGLVEAQLPLVKVIRPAARSGGKLFVVDKSSVARAFYSKARLKKYRMHRPHSSADGKSPHR